MPTLSKTHLADKGQLTEYGDGCTFSGVDPVEPNDVKLALDSMSGPNSPGNQQNLQQVSMII